MDDPFNQGGKKGVAGAHGIGHLDRIALMLEQAVFCDKQSAGRTSGDGKAEELQPAAESTGSLGYGAVGNA